MNFSLKAFAALAICAACSACSATKPAEVLDERSGMTIGALQRPIEFVESARNAALAGGKRASFAYLGPVEWDSSGEISYALWVHVAPGNDKPVADIAAPGAVTLDLDDGPVVLSHVEPPKFGDGPYQPIAAWGQTAYFALDAALLKRIASSRKLALVFRSTDESTVDFPASHDTSPALEDFLRDRGITP